MAASPLVLVPFRKNRRVRCPEFVEEARPQHEPGQPGQNAQVSLFVPATDEKENVGQDAAVGAEGNTGSRAAKGHHRFAERVRQRPAWVWDGDAVGQGGRHQLLTLHDRLEQRFAIVNHHRLFGEAHQLALSRAAGGGTHRHGNARLGKERGHEELVVSFRGMPAFQRA